MPSDQTVIGHLSEANPDYRHPFLQSREVKRVGYIVISTDRGLCGCQREHVPRGRARACANGSDEGVEADLCLVGAKGIAFFRRLKVNVVAATSHLGEKPKVQDLVGASPRCPTLPPRQDRPALPRAQRVRQHDEPAPTISQLLPVEAIDKEALQTHWDYIYEPDAGELLDGVLDRYIESQVYRGAVENVACEMASKMVAMKAATDNAGKFIEGLQLQYNKARQAAITREIAEIVGGAAAV